MPDFTAVTVDFIDADPPPAQAFDFVAITLAADVQYAATVFFADKFCRFLKAEFVIAFIVPVTVTPPAPIRLGGQGEGGEHGQQQNVTNQLHGVSILVYQ